MPLRMRTASRAEAIPFGPIAPDSRREIGVLSREVHDPHGIEHRDPQDDHARQKAMSRWMIRSL